MAIKLLGRERQEPEPQTCESCSPQERVEYMLRYLHNCVGKDLPETPLVRQKREWIEETKRNFEPRFKWIKISEMREQSRILYEDRKNLRKNLEAYRLALLGLCATETLGGDPPETKAKKLTKIDEEIAEAWEKEQEYLDAYNRSIGWGNTAGCRTGYQMIVGSPLHELADVAAAKYYECRGEIHAGENGHFLPFASLLFEHVTDTKPKTYGFLGACRKAASKIKKRQKEPRRTGSK